MTLDAPVLENDFVRLEPLEEKHREPLRAAADDPDLWRYASVNQHGGTYGGNFDDWMDARLLQGATSDECSWSVLDKSSNKYAGSTSYLAVSLVNKRLEIGWTWYAKPFWAGPVNPSCKRMLFAYGFEALGLNRVEMKLDATNLRSFRAIARLGARFEGIHRAHMVMPDGRIRDTAWFSVTKAEWPEVRDGLDTRLAVFAQA